MVNGNYFKGIAILVLIILGLSMQAAAAPVLSSPSNNITGDGTLSFSVNVSDTVHFSAVSNETENVTWKWFINGSGPYPDNNISTFDFFFDSVYIPTKIITVNVTNETTGLSSDPIEWTITIQATPSPPSLPTISGWGNTKTNNDSLTIEINRTDSVTFNATANQTITTWNWFVNGTNKFINADNFNYQFNYGGKHHVSVNGTNANGTTDNTKVWTIEVADNEPPANITISSNTSGTSWINWIWSNPSLDVKHTEVYIDGIFKTNAVTNSYNTSPEDTFDLKTTHNISLRPVDFSDNIGNWTNGSASTSATKPIITRKDPMEAVNESTGLETRTYVIQVDQISNVTWTVGSTTQTNQTLSLNSLVNFTFTPTSTASYNISVSGTNDNGTSNTISWNWTIHPTTYSSGNRIWDGESNPNDFSTTYTWTPQSFSGFYYDAKDGVGSENIQIKSISRSISKDNIIYSTSPNEVSFIYEPWGKYQVIGFMADKYFAGYKNHTILDPTNSFDDISTIGQNQLHKVLIDEDVKRTISVGGTLALKDGYVLQASDIDLNARTMFLRLLKDGSEVDSTPLAKDETYVYQKKVGNVDNLPLIMVRFDNVFSGTELQVAFLKGIFQISEDVATVKPGNKFGNMEVTTVSKEKIEMKNSNSIGLNRGSIVDLMGDLKIIVADNADLRFALSVDRKGSFEVRSTIYDESDANRVTTWTPYNFGMNIGKTIIGFYYNLDDGLGNEMLSMSPNPSGSIPDNDLVYSTKPEQVSFTYEPWGKYQVIGFMAEQYFAGYSGHTILDPTNSFDDISAIAQGQLHKVLIDDDTKSTISVGGTLALKEGYVLQASDIDLKGRTMFLRLLKDGSEVDSTPLAKDETYVYQKKVGNVDNLPLIMVRFDNVFSGTELQVAFLKGIFQLSETATTIKVGNQFGKMDVTAVSANEITMKNDGSIGLDKNKNEVLMGNIRLKVADSDTLRFYFAVDVTEDMIANQLAISAPTKVMAGDTLNIKVTAGGTAVDNSSLSLDTEMGTTDINGELNYTIPRTLKAGNYTITATKTGYEKATKSIDIEKYVDLRLSIEMPTKANQYETIIIKVLYNGSAMSGASVLFDNTSIGTTDSNGEVSYRLETSGTHSITASKTSYIAVSRDVDIRAPYSEFKALDINVTPNPVFAGEDFLIKSNITNVGTKSDSLPVDLIINGTVVDNRTITIGPNEKVEINFTRQEPLVTNVTVDIMGQNVLLQVQEKPTNYLLIAAIATGIAAVIIYVLTSKGLLSLEILKQKFELLSNKLSTLFKK